MKHVAQLKKLTPQKILEMRQMRREGHKIANIAYMYKVCCTTVDWHVGDITLPYRMIGEYQILNERAPEYVKNLDTESLLN